MSNTPDSPAEKPDHRMDQGENFWALFTPGIWKGLHAVLQIMAVGRSMAEPPGIYADGRGLLIVGG